MDKNSDSIILIGMPGAGKSTIGLLLAKKLAKDFVDTDVLIQVQTGRTLQDIVNVDGYLALREIEEKILIETHYTNHVIATGGSAVYSEKAMRHLKRFGPIFYLDVPLVELFSRIKNFDTRGLARRPDQSFDELFAERQALYESYADMKIECANKTPEEIIDIIAERIISTRFT